MSVKKVIQISNRGGARVGAGRPRGANKVRISITIDKTLHGITRKLSEGNFSGLVESALTAYMKQIKSS